MLSRNVLYYGNDDPLPEQIPLHAGPLVLIYEQGDLRYVKMGDQEVLRRVYIAIRDHNWGTIPPFFSNVQMDIATDSFYIAYDVENKRGEIDFAWKGTITGDTQGTITFSMDGVAHSTFRRNRIGFCVLHPAICAGAVCIVEHVDGRTEQSHLPTFIVADQPVQPFAEIQSLVHEVMPGLWAKVYFSGDIFEMEDQRNWTDASFKTFCTPLRLPYPVEIKQGTRIRQSVVLSIEDKRPTVSVQGVELRQIEAPSLVFTLNKSTSPKPVPLLGLGVASHEQPLSVSEIARLKRLNLNHLRTDLRLSDLAYPARLALATRQAQQLGIKLEVATFVSPNIEDELTDLKRVLEEVKPPVATWLVYPAKEGYQGGSPTDVVVKTACAHLAAYDPTAQFATGTNHDYIFLKRNPPSLEHLDTVCFAINPQVHAFDNASLVETLEAQAIAVASARRLAQDLPVIVSPVTLKPRFNPYATGPVPVTPPGELPPQVDVRQMSLFGAGWTVGCLKYLAESGAAQATYYETTGWRGVMETESGSPLPGVYCSLPGCAFPMYHVFADVGEYAEGCVIPARSSNPLHVDGLALGLGGKMRLLLANYTPRLQHIIVKDVAQQVWVRSLDEICAEEAMRSPEAFRSRPGRPVKTLKGMLELDLLPFAVATIDTEG